MATDDRFPANIGRLGQAPERADPDRGMFFLALCADLARQFEFIQQTWLNNPKQAGRYDEVDPLAAGDGIVGDGRRFSIPRPPVRLRLSDVGRWVTVRVPAIFCCPAVEPWLN